jgi:hypothetical protein
MKFFKIIRHNLLSEGNTGKYLKYAIGEIILVVIGILIALQINNWNQDRLDRITEIKHLKTIEKEITSNTNQNQSIIINRLPKKIEGLKLAKKFCENKLIVTDTLEFLNKVSYGGVFSGWYNFGERNSYDELINTGNLHLIRKDTVKNAIVNYYLYISVINERAKAHSSHFLSYTNELRPFNTENPTFISKYDQVEMMESFKSAEFKKLVDLELSYAYKIRDYIKKVESIGEQTINIIKSELKGEL